MTPSTHVQNRLTELAAVPDNLSGLITSAAILLLTSGELKRMVAGGRCLGGDHFQSRDF